MVCAIITVVTFLGRAWDLSGGKRTRLDPQGFSDPFWGSLALHLPSPLNTPPHQAQRIGEILLWALPLNPSHMLEVNALSPSPPGLT